MHTNPFPYTITEKKTAIKDRNRGILSRIKFAIDIDQNLCIPKILNIIVGSTFIRH